MDKRYTIQTCQNCKRDKTVCFAHEGPCHRCISLGLVDSCVKPREPPLAYSVWERKDNRDYLVSYNNTFASVIGWGLRDLARLSVKNILLSLEDNGLGTIVTARGAVTTRIIKIHLNSSQYCLCIYPVC